MRLLHLVQTNMNKNRQYQTAHFEEISISTMRPKELFTGDMSYNVTDIKIVRYIQTHKDICLFLELVSRAILEPMWRQRLCLYQEGRDCCIHDPNFRFMITNVGFVGCPWISILFISI